MYTEAELVIGFIFGIALGISLMILASLSKKTGTELSEDVIAPQNDAHKKVAPFIQIHQSLMEENYAPSREESLQRLKAKVESFKRRNRFYHGK